MQLMRKILATDWKPPQLIALPKRFEDFYEADRKFLVFIIMKIGIEFKKKIENV